MAARLAAFDFEATTRTLQSIWDWSRTVQYIIQGLPYSSSLLTSPLLTLWILASSVFDYADRILHCVQSIQYVTVLQCHQSMTSNITSFFSPLLFYLFFCCTNLSSLNDSIACSGVITWKFQAEFVDLILFFTIPPWY